MEPWIFWIVTILFGVLCQDSNAKTHFKYMTNYCSETVEVTASLVIVLSPSEVLKSERSPDYFHCSVDLMAAKGRRLQAGFLQLSISSNEKHTDRLKLFDLIPGRPRIPLTPVQGLYGMLDRSMKTSDKSGATIGEYRSNGRWMQVEYLGKPTRIHSGFRMLVTTTADMTPGDNKCPPSMSACTNHQWCIPSILLCDGYPNCGHRQQDASDENGCDLSNLVSSVSYSLAEDIGVIIFIPLIVFILAVVVLLLLTRWHVNRKYPYHEPAVRYSNSGDGDVALDQAVDEPPSYTEAIASAKPPDYNMLDELEREGRVTVGSDDDDCDSKHHYRHQKHPHHYPTQYESDDNHRHHHDFPTSRNEHRVHERRGGDILLTTSNSSIEQIDDGSCGGGGSSRPTNHHHSNHRPKRMSPRHVALNLSHDLNRSFSEDEETKHKAKKKGGKCKSAKGKRRAYDNFASSPSAASLSNHVTTASTTINDNNIDNDTATIQPTSCKTVTSLPHSNTSNSSSLASPSSDNSNLSVPSSSIDNNTTTTPPSLSTVFSSTHSSSLQHINSSASINNNDGLTNGANVLDSREDTLDKPMNNRHNHHQCPPSLSSPVAVLPLTSSSCLETAKPSRGSRFHPEAVHSSDNIASGPKADMKSETESSMGLAGSKCKTESCASSNSNGSVAAFLVKRLSGETTTDLKLLKKEESGVKLGDKLLSEKRNGSGGKSKKTAKKSNGKTRSIKSSGDVTKKNGGGGKVDVGLIPLDKKAIRACDDNLSDCGNLGDDADISSESDDGGIEVNRMKQEILPLKGNKLLTQV